MILSTVKKYVITFIMFLIGISLCGCQSNSNTEKTNKEKIGDIEEQYGLSLREETITIDGLEKDYEFLFIADNHVLLYETENIDAWNWSTQTRIDSFTNGIGVTSAEAFPAWIELANLMEVDGVLFGGDVLDYITEKNVNYCKNEIDKLNMPYMYTMGNHDSYDALLRYGGGPRDTNELLDDFFLEGSRDFQILDYEEFYVVSVNNGTKYITEDVLNRFKYICSKEKPIILMMHIPFTTEETEELTQDTIDSWGSAILIGPEPAMQYGEVTMEFYDLVLDENSPVVAVLAGHIHMYHKDMLNENIVQIVSDTSSNGNGIFLKVTGEESN